MNDMTNVPAVPERFNEIAIAQTAGGSVFAPQSVAEVMQFAQLMARADQAIPKTMRGNPGLCLAVSMQAMRWGMDPFMVASKAVFVNDRIGYEAQLIAAVVNTRAGLKTRLAFAYSGDGNTRTCIVTGEFTDGSVRTYETPPFDRITPKNSPLWKTDPDQQLGYYAARAWARRHTPEVLLGVYDRDELATIQREEPAAKPHETLVARLTNAGAKAAAPIIEHVERETAPESSQKAHAAQQAQAAINPAPDNAPQPQVQDKPAADDAKVSSESMPERSDAAGDSDDDIPADDGPTPEQRKEMQEIERMQAVARKYAALHTRDELKAWADTLFPQDRNRIRGIKDELNELALAHEAEAARSLEGA